MDKERILKAGQIAKQVVDYAKTITKKDVPLLEISEKIEFKIIELGGRPAFPVNLSTNEIAAHYTPTIEDKTLASGLLKIDIGVHVDGWIADTAFSIDLENSKENKQLIQTAEQALENAIELIKQKSSETTLGEIGQIIQKTIELQKFSPITNLTGHGMEQYDLHAGISIPNIDTKQSQKIDSGLYAIEPFSTTGSGKVKDGKPSEIYLIKDTKTPRSQLAREILEYALQEYQTLPFCSRWIIRKFGAKAKIALKQLEENSNLHHFKQLAEVSGAKVAQAEHTLLIEGEKVIVTTN